MFATEAASGKPFAARGISCQHGSTTLFTALDISLASGHALLLRGRNGSGKTSLLRILAGLRQPTQGELCWLHGMANQAGTLYAGHQTALKDDLTAIENLSFAAQLDGRAATRTELNDAVQQVGLHSRSHLLARQLSQGQRRRIVIARLLLARRPLWLLDEPDSALDADGIELLQAVIRTHLERGGLAIVATHHALDLGANVAELTLQ